MSLIKCPECGNEISDKAPACPSCGCPVTPIPKSTPLGETVSPSKPQGRSISSFIEEQNQLRQTQVQAPIVIKQSGLGIAALILSVLGCTFFIGAILAIIDLCKKDNTKKHGLSIAALIICGVWLLIVIIFGSSASSTKQQTTKINEATHTEITDTNISAVEGSTDTNVSIESTDKQVLFEKDGLIITAEGMIDDSIWGKGIKLLLENNSDKNLGVSCNAVIVNNYMLSDLFSSSIASGKKSNENLYLSSTQLEAAGIENIGQIELYFHIFDGDSYETIFDSDCVTIKTSEFDKMDIVAMDDGQELLNQNGLRIVGKYVNENSFWGTAILLYIDNKTGSNISVSCENMSINGFMVNPLFSSTIYNDRMSIDDITIFSTDLENNGIEKISDIEFQFHVFNSDDYSTVFDSETIAFTVD